MGDVLGRYQKVAGTFTLRVEGAPPEAWDNQSPCEEWTARDIIGHLKQWMRPVILEPARVECPAFPSLKSDPVGGWLALDDAVQRALASPELMSKTVGGGSSLSDYLGLFALFDVLVHTWDLARATGQDETIDAVEAARLLESMREEEAVRRHVDEREHFGPAIEIPDDADIQTKLIAYTGRQP